jgi:hypothetical protein
MAGPTSFSVELNLKAPGADGFQPLNVSENKPKLQAFLMRCILKLNGVDANVDQGFIERFIDNLRQTELFTSVVKATEIPFNEVEKRVELSLATTEINDSNQGEACCLGCLIAWSLGLLSLVLYLHNDFTSEMVLDVKRWDGARKRYSAKSSGRLSHGLFANHKLGGIALGGAVTTCNINSLMNQMIADAAFYLM